MKLSTITNNRFGNAILVLILTFLGSIAMAQNARTIPATIPQISIDNMSPSCGQQQITADLFRTQPAIQSRHLAMEAQLRNEILSGKFNKKPNAASRTSVVTLPVVVHIIHNNGTENISDAQAITAIQHLNEAFANSGFYDPTDGVNTDIQFCMAERDPNNNPTNGITRDISPYTVMGGASYYSDDQNVKNIRRWNPECYINIWIVKSIPGSVAGYAYLPSAHGTNVDGIIVEAAYFGSSYTNDVVNIHEMGHYLGLYHTFEGNCTNNDCTNDGDKVCDTPPDQSTAGIACGSSMNSCSTDALSGFATDQPDLTQDYMDYGNFNCMKVFTAGQSTRMSWFIDNVRSSLLHCKSCMPPCPAPVVVAVSSPGATINAGLTYTFLNSTVNATNFEWWINGTLIATSTNLTFTFTNVGSYTILLIAKSVNPLCDSSSKTITINAVCPVLPNFNSSATTVGAGTNINFTNTSTGATNYEWSVNGVLQSTATNFTYTSTTAGAYVITLNAINTAAQCKQSFSDTVYFTCPVTADFNPSSVTVLLNTPTTFTSTSVGASSYQWLINGVVSGAGPSLTHSFTLPGSYTIQLIASNSVCSATKTGIVYVTDKCGNAIYLYRKQYHSVDGSVNIQDVQTSNDGGTINCGIMVDGTKTVTMLMKLDPAGNVQWIKNYGNPYSGGLLKVRPTQDGGYIAIGVYITATAIENLFIVKTAADGTLTWAKQLNMDAATSGTNIIQSLEGDYYFSGTITNGAIANSTNDALIGRLDVGGNVMWMRSYDARGSETPTSLASDGNNIIVCGNLVGQGGALPGFLLQLNKANGNPNWATTYSAGDQNFQTVLARNGGYFVDALRTNGTAGVYTDHVYLLMDAVGTLNYANYVIPFGPARAIRQSSVFLKSNGNIVSQSTPVGNSGALDFVTQELNPATGITWSKNYGDLTVGLRGISKKADNSFYGSGYKIVTGITDAFQISLDSLGNGGTCPANPINMELLRANYATQVADFLGKALQPLFITDHPTIDKMLTTNTICQFVGCDSTIDTCARCQSIDITGPDSICKKSAAPIYKAARDSACTLPVSWSVIGGAATLINATDSTVGLTIVDSGMVKLIGTMITPCKTIHDTVLIHIFQQPGSIDLGPDLMLCKQSAVRLSAGAGFKSYLWQDGSVDSVFTAYLPGQYYVTAFDNCGNSYSDTMNITLGPDIPFDIGPDTTICKGDSVLLTATAGFNSYSWSPINYNISNPYDQSSFVFPLKDTTYTCVAFKYAGCTVTDTIHISVKEKPANFLDSTISICKGERVQLIPSGTWNDYRWSTGEQTTTINVGIPGDYTLLVENTENCQGKDTINVREIPCIKGIYFPNAFTPNSDGHNDEFRALLDVKPIKFYLTIYNRWGEKVFETRDSKAGWNGVFKGRPQDSAAFVWYATYQLPGETKESFAKGIAVLIR